MSIIDKLLKNLFYFFIFFLPWQTGLILREPFLNGVKWHYGTIIFYFTDFILLLLFSLFIFYSLKSSLTHLFQREERKKEKSLNSKSLPLWKRGDKGDFFLLPKILILFLAWSLLSIFWSPDKELALYSFIKLSSAIALFFIILNIKIGWKKTLLVFLFSALIQTGLGFHQFFSQEAFPNKYLGLSAYNPEDPGVSVIETPERRWLRAYGSFSHPNILGGYLTISLLLGIYLYLKNKESENFSSLFLNIFFLISLGVLFAGLLISLSRSAWLSFFLSLMFLFLFLIVKKQKVYFFNFAKTSLLFLFIAILFFFSLHEVFLSRINTSGRLEAKSVEERADYTLEAKNLIKENLLSGVGVGNYTLVNYKKLNNNQPAWYYQPVHNVYLLILTELGIFGLILFLLVIFYPFYFFIKNKYFDLKNMILALAVFSFLLIMFFDHYLWSSHFGILFFFLILGLFVKNIFRKPDNVLK